MKILCRACLATENDMVPLNIDFVNKFNLLTSLDIKLSDNVPLYMCSSCCNAVEFCTEFIDKCILSDLKFKELLIPNYEPEVYINKTDEYLTKDEIKLEYDSDSNLLEDYHEPEIPCVTRTIDRQHLRRKIKSEQKKESAPAKKKVAKKDENIIENCGICSETFADMENLVKHLDVHKKDLSCGLCTESFIDLTHLLSHRIVHLPDNNKKCHLCLKKVNSAPRLEYHYINMHNLRGEDGKLICKLCLTPCQNPKKLQRHVKFCHSDKMYICDHCGKRCSQRGSLKSHLVIHYDRVHKCDKCSFSCKQMGGLTVHKMRKHTKGSVNCKYCGKMFASQDLKDKHPCKYPTGMICPVCGAQGIKFSNLSRHLRSHRSVTNYQCDRCPSVFKSSYTLKVHKDRHEGNKTEHCDYCPMKFYCRSSLIKHRRTHTGERPYACKMCGKGFMTNYNLKVHMKVHGLDLIVKKAE